MYSLVLERQGIFSVNNTHLNKKYNSKQKLSVFAWKLKFKVKPVKTKN